MAGENFERNLKMQLNSGITMLEDNRAAVRLGLDCKPMPVKGVKQLSMDAPESIEDLVPKDSDYIDIPFRSLSAKYLGEQGYHLDFSKKDILKNSIPLIMTPEFGGLRSKPIKAQRNHSYAIEDTLGSVPTAWWDNSKKEFSAPGINVAARIDWKMYPKEARKLLSTPPLIDSVSWSFMFNYEQSHPDMKWWQFMDLLGHEVDGETVRLVVTEILEYYHLGLVWNGGDNEATQTTATPAESNLSFAPEVDTPEELPVPYSNLQVQLENNKPKLNPSHKEETMEFIIKDLSKFQDLLGLDKVESEGDLLSAVQGLSEAVEELRTEQKELKPNAELGKTYLADTRAEVLRLAKVVHDGELEKTREDLILNANLETLKMLETDYQSQEAKLFPNVCQDCGSSNIKLRSSREEHPEEPAGSTAVNEAQFQTGVK